MNLLNTAFTSQPSPELLYVSGCFQVRLRQLSSGAAPIRLPSENSVRSRCFPIEGGVRAESPSHGVSTVSYGQMLDVSAAQPVLLWGMEARTALLEISQGSTAQAAACRPGITETRPWGSFTVLRDDPRYKLKQLRVQPGSRLSLQRHQRREEHWIVLKGSPRIVLDDRELALQPGDYLHVPCRAWHRLFNPSSGDAEDEMVEVVEIQLGDYFGEDDIERCADDYGRA